MLRLCVQGVGYTRGTNSNCCDFRKWWAFNLARASVLNVSFDITYPHELVSSNCFCLFVYLHWDIDLYLPQFSLCHTSFGGMWSCMQILGRERPRDWVIYQAHPSIYNPSS